MSERIYPWQHGLWQRLRQLQGRMPHALLLHGRPGVGKQHFAMALAEALLCEQPDAEGYACGQCVSCGWLSQGNHPDFRLVEPEDQAEDDAVDPQAEPVAATKTKRKSRLILIEQVRALADLLGLTTHRHGLRVVLLHPAETLNLNAANALLKMLEEPPPATLFILVTHQLPRLLPTIRSRCHKLAMPVPPRAEAEAWLAQQGLSDAAFGLAQSGGAPLAALESDNAELRSHIEGFATQLIRGERVDAAASAAHWSREDYPQALSALQKWSYDLAVCRLAAGVRYFPAQSASLQAMAKSVDLAALLDFQRTLAQARAQANHPLNTELQLEALLIRYSQMFASTVRP